MKNVNKYGWVIFCVILLLLNNFVCCVYFLRYYVFILLIIGYFNVFSIGKYVFDNNVYNEFMLMWLICNYIFFFIFWSYNMKLKNVNIFIY